MIQKKKKRVLKIYLGSNTFHESWHILFQISSIWARNYIIFIIYYYIPSKKNLQIYTSLCFKKKKIKTIVVRVRPFWSLVNQRQRQHAPENSDRVWEGAHSKVGVGIPIQVHIPSDWIAEVRRCPLENLEYTGHWSEHWATNWAGWLPLRKTQTS